MFQLMGQAADVNPWAQFGLAGLVIAALLAGFGVLLKFLVNYISKLDTSHRAERTEWRESNEQMQTEFRDTIERTSTQFADTVKEISSNR